MIALSAASWLALSATRPILSVMEVIDPFEELTGQDLRNVIERCLEGPGRVSIGYHDGQDRMAERGITGGQIIAALRGALRTDCRVAGKWRYIGRKNDVEVCFTFDVDEDGELLIVVTVMRN
jgi:hypothetical protein